MIVYVFSAPLQHNGQPQQFQPGDVTGVAIACPDGTDVEAARQFIRQSGVTAHMQGRVRFAHAALPDPLNAPRLLMLQQIPAQPMLTRAGPGQMPTGAPTAQPGQQASQVDPQSGFQVLGEEAGGGQESMYGEVDDHTNQDIVDGQEVPRPG